MKKIIPLLLLLTLGACKEPEIPATVIRPAQVWTVSDQATTRNGVTYSGETKAREEADLAFRLGGQVVIPAGGNHHHAAQSSRHGIHAIA